MLYSVFTCPNIIENNRNLFIHCTTMLLVFLLICFPTKMGKMGKRGRERERKESLEKDKIVYFFYYDKYDVS